MVNAYKVSNSNPYLFTGRRVDILDSGSLKIQYNRNRYYDYYSGRWLTHDPLGIAPNAQLPNRFDAIDQYIDSINLYQYVLSNPLIEDDPFGLVVNCYGGKWYVTGTIKSVGCGPVSYYWLKLKWWCKRRYKYGRYDYGNHPPADIQFSKDYYQWPVAYGTSKIFGLAPGLGHTRHILWGEVSGAPTSAHLAGRSWASLGASFSIPILGGTGTSGGGDDCTHDTGTGELAALGFSFTILCGEWTTVLRDEYELKEENLSLDEQARWDAGLVSRTLTVLSPSSANWETVDLPPSEKPSIGCLEGFPEEEPPPEEGPPEVAR